MSLYTVQINKSDYSEVTLKSSDKDDVIISNPEFFKGFFDEDLVIYETIDTPLKLVERNISNNIPGVLELFGTYKFKPNKRGVPAYLFRPLNKGFPIFTVHSTLKRNSTCNKIVTIKFREWSDKIPSGEIVRVLGDVNDVNAVQNGMLFKYDVYPNKSNYNLKNHSPIFDFTSRHHIEDCIYSIDPDGCTDIDDAFSISQGKIYIHISDVYSFLENNSLLDKVNNITSIYLIDNIMHSIDTKLSTNWCSLVEGTEKYMITLEIDFDTKNYSIYPSYGTITGNFSYDEYPDQVNSHFNEIEELYKHFIGIDKAIKDSHQFIEALMIIYNHLYVKNLVNSGKKPIYRIQEKSNRLYENVSNDLERFLNIISSKAANYSWDDIGHDHLGLVSGYSHTTSPIRRIVDLLNQEIYYGKDILIKKFNINNINNYNNSLKKFYRKLDLIKLAYILEESGYQEVKCYIYDFVDDCLQIFIPNFKLSISYRIINEKSSKFSNLEFNNDNLTLSVDNKTYCYKLREETPIKIYGKLNINNINESVKIEF